MAPVRGVWLTNVDSEVLFSRAAIAEALRDCAAAGLNTVFPVVWNKGYTLFPSDVMAATFGEGFRLDPAHAGRDPLQEVIEEGQALGLKVVPWFEYGFAASFGSHGPGRHLLDLRPDWAGLDRHGQRLEKNGFIWLNALSPEVQTFMGALILEVVHRYPVDGIQGDDRLPAFPVEGGYDTASKARFRQAFGVDPPADCRDARWMRWRADRLTDFLACLAAEARAIRRDLVLSMAPSPFRFAYREYLQDPLTGLRRGLVDWLHPQLYRRSLSAYRRAARETTAPLTARQISRVSPGVLIRVGGDGPRPDLLWSMIRLNRSLGFRGEVLFFHAGLSADDGALGRMLSARGYGSFQLLRRGHQGDDVAELQGLLAEKGYDVGPLDGDFGPKTQAAVGAFQRDRGLRIDGVVGPNTDAAFRSDT